MQNSNDMQKIVLYTPHTSSLPEVPEEELRALDFYQGRLVAELAGYYITSHLWSHYLLQLCRSEPAVRHGLVALSSICEQIQDPSTTRQRFALVHYGKAMRLVARRDASSVRDVVLIVSILLGAFERVAGRRHSAFVHRIGGLRMLAERGSVGAIPIGLLQSTFVHFDTETLELGQPAFGVQTSPTTLPGLRNVFCTIHDAWQSFESLYNRLLRGLKTIHHTPCEQSYNIHQTVWKYKEWCMLFDQYLQSLVPTANNSLDQELLGVLTLQIRRLLVHIILHLDAEGEELRFEPFSAEFECMVTLAELFLAQTWKKGWKTRDYSKLTPSLVTEAEVSDNEAWMCRGLLGVLSCNLPVITATEPRLDPQVLSSSSDLLVGILSSKVQSACFIPDMPNRPTFSIAPGIICPLFVTAMHCCQSGTRDRAIQLLQLCNRTEGQWDSNFCARLAERKRLQGDSVAVLAV